MTRAALAAVLAVAGCGAPPDPADPEPVPVDSALVGVLTDVALAEARASIGAPGRRAADSLRAVALSVHGLTEADLRDRHADLARDPLVARATYDALDRALTDERNRR